MQLFVLDDEYRITSRFDPPCEKPITLPLRCERLPRRIEVAVREVTQSWTNEPPAETCSVFVEPNIVVYVSRIMGAQFSGLAVRAWFAAQCTQTGDKRMRSPVL